MAAPADTESKGRHRAVRARKNAVANGREQEFHAALDTFCDEWYRDGRFEKEFLLSVGTSR